MRTYIAGLALNQNLVNALYFLVRTHIELASSSYLIFLLMGLERCTSVLPTLRVAILPTLRAAILPTAFLVRLQFFRQLFLYTS